MVNTRAMLFTGAVTVPTPGIGEPTPGSESTICRGIVQFSMQDGPKEIACAISTSAMDDLERGPKARPAEREAQFTRLRDRIEAQAASKYRATEFEGTPPGIVLRSIDFRG